MANVIGQFFKNVLTTWAGMVVSLSVAFFFTPYLITMLGKEQYGIWNLAFSLIAYLGLADLGLKQSIVRFISKYLATKDWKQLNEVYSSSIKIYTYVSLLIVVVVMAVAFYFIRFFKIDPAMFETARMVIIILGINEAIAYACLPIYSLGAYHRFDITAYFKISRLIIQTLAIFVLLELGMGLLEMAITIMILNLFFIFGLNAIRRKLFPQNRFSFEAITKEKTKMLLDYGIYSFLIVGAWILIFQSDNIIIGTFISMEAVAIYSVAAMIITQIRGAIQIIAVPLVPAISHFEAEDDLGKITSIYHKSTKYMYYLSAYIAISILIYGGPFILLWVKKEFAMTIDILHILVVAAAIYLPQTIANSILFGISRHKIAFYVLLAEAVTKITLSVVLLHFYGIIGVAYGTAIPQLLIYLFVYPVVFHKVIGAPVMKFYKTASVSILTALILLVPVGYLMSRLMVPDNWISFIVGNAVVGLIMVGGLLIFVLEKDDRIRIIDKVMGRFRK